MTRPWRADIEARVAGRDGRASDNTDRASGVGTAGITLDRASWVATFDSAIEAETLRQQLGPRSCGASSGLAGRMGLRQGTSGSQTPPAHTTAAAGTASSTTRIAATMACALVMVLPPAKRRGGSIYERRRIADTLEVLQGERRPGAGWLWSTSTYPTACGVRWSLRWAEGRLVIDACCSISAARSSVPRRQELRGGHDPEQHALAPTELRHGAALAGSALTRPRPAGPVEGEVEDGDEAAFVHVIQAGPAQLLA